MNRHHLRFKRVMRYDPSLRMLRLCRWVWQRGVVGDGRGYPSKLTIALRPAVLSWHKEWDGWLPTVAGVRVHYRRSWGGVDV
jgi:hypothetical protein